MTLIDGKCVKNSHTSAVKSRNNLFHHAAVRRTGKKALMPKVCCLCDTFVKNGDEKLLPLKSLLNEKVVGLLSIDNENWSEMAITESVKNVLKDQHTQKSVTTKNHHAGALLWLDPEHLKQLNSLILSPKSCAMMKNDELHFGACNQCHSTLQRCINSDSGKSVDARCKFIACGLASGYAPDVLTCLNEVELALVSRARINQHMFSFRGGSHKKVIGCHTLYCSKCDETNKVGNFMRSINAKADFSKGEFLWVTQGVTHHVAQFESVINSDDDNPVQTHINVQWQSNKKTETVPIASVTRLFEEQTGRSRNEQAKANKFKPSVKVILAGPFTPDQKAMTLKATEVNFDRCKAALLWLKENNCLCKDIVVDESIAKPIVMDFSDLSMSVDSNIEKTIVTKTVFPDHQHTNQSNGGCETAEQFKIESFKNMTNNNSKLIARPSVDMLKDCKDDNLLKAFVIQFPFGVGE